MKKTKRVFEVYSFCDYDGYAKRFGRMAEKGWLIERVMPFFFVYRRIEPKKLTFFISYFAKASEFDPEPGSEQSEFIEFCERTGWKLAMRSAQMQVFYNENEHPVPIETDPVLEVETIHKAAKRSYLPTFLVFLALSLFELWTLLERMEIDPLSVLAGGSTPFACLMNILLLLVCFVELSAYFLWLRRARRQARETGTLAPSVSHRKFQLVVLWLFLLVFGAFLVSIATSGSRLRIFVLAAMLVGEGLAIFVVWKLKSFLKRKGVSRGANIFITLAAATALSFALVFAVLFVAVGFIGPDDPVTEEIPLSLNDLYGEDAEVDAQDVIRDGSIILSSISVTQYEAAGSDVYYVVYQVKLPFLTPLIRRVAERNVDEYHRAWGGCLLSMNPDHWHADKAFRNAGKVGLGDNWLLFYGNRIIILNFEGEPTQDQMDTIAEKLGGKGE